jgi:hypothetical protein
MAEPVTPPTTAEELRSAILDRYESLSKRLKQIARYVLDEPNAVALETLAVLADRSGVQPSAIVRFAKSFGFDGATQMQRLFRDGLLSGNAALAYGERVRQFSETVDGKAVGDPGQVLAEFIEGNTLALQNLGEIVSSADMAAAVKMMAQADTIYVAGFRRSFPGRRLHRLLAAPGGQEDGLYRQPRRHDPAADSRHHAQGPADLRQLSSLCGRGGPADRGGGRAGLQGAVHQRQPGQPRRQAGQSGAAGARGRNPQIPVAVRLDVPGPGVGDFVRLLDGPDRDPQPVVDEIHGKH